MNHNPLIFSETGTGIVSCKIDVIANWVGVTLEYRNTVFFTGDKSKTFAFDFVVSCGELDTAVKRAEDNINDSFTQIIGCQSKKMNEYRYNLSTPVSHGMSLQKDLETIQCAIKNVLNKYLLDAAKPKQQNTCRIL